MTHYTTNPVQIRKNIVLLGSIFLLLSQLACTSMPMQQSVPTHTFNDDGSINAYIEIPAGCNVKYELGMDNKTLKPDQKGGEDRLIDFLPYPGNYGFIAATDMDEKAGGDGDALDVLILCDARESGTVMKVLPLGVILLEDNGKKDHKIIAVPFDESERTINVEKFSAFITKYNAAQFIVQEWFMNYKGLGQMTLLGWKDEQYALSEIKKWSTNK